MAERTVRDLLGDIPEMEYELEPTSNINPEQIWADYDELSDSFIVYTTGKPTSGVHVHIEDDFYLIVDRRTHKVIGYYIENWQRSFVPAHKELFEVWESSAPKPLDAWISLMRLMALWVLMLISTSSKSRTGGLQPQPA